MRSRREPWYEPLNRSMSLCADPGFSPSSSCCSGNCGTMVRGNRSAKITTYVRAYRQSIEVGRLLRVPLRGRLVGFIDG